ncbi:MAG: hypothetical protein F6K04_08635 [Leptolyngbya sp. SIO4C5]|nr:hypothetical protein [Leptolyngbya sp. SIO4C5]
MARQILVSRETSERIKQLLKQRARTPRPLTVADVLKSLRPSVSRMLKQGHGYRDVIEALAAQNIVVSLEVIEAFYQSQVSGKGKGKRPAKSHPELEQVVTQVQLDAIAAALKELAKTRRGQNLRELVAELEEAIDEDLAAGWSYDHIADWLDKDFSLKIAPGSLRSYHQALKREKKEKKGDRLQKSAAAMPSKIQPQTPSPKRLPEPATAGFQDAANPIFNAALDQHSLL